MSSAEAPYVVQSGIIWYVETGRGLVGPYASRDAAVAAIEVRAWPRSMGGDGLPMTDVGDPLECLAILNGYESFEAMKRAYGQREPLLRRIAGL